MSKYCGKCDFYDHYADEDWGKFVKTSTIRLGKHKLDIKTELDLLKYAPYIICLGAYSDGVCTLELTREPFIDSEERDSIKFMVENAQYYYRKYKREGKDFIPEEVAKEHPTVIYKEMWNTILNRVKDNPKNPEVKDICTPSAEHYRKLWIEDLVSKGMTETEAILWVYPDEKKFLILKERGLLDNVKF